MLYPPQISLDIPFKEKLTFKNNTCATEAWKIWRHFATAMISLVYRSVCLSGLHFWWHCPFNRTVCRIGSATFCQWLPLPNRELDTTWKLFGLKEESNFFPCFQSFWEIQKYFVCCVVTNTFQEYKLKEQFHPWQIYVFLLLTQDFKRNIHNESNSPAQQVTAP